MDFEKVLVAAGEASRPRVVGEGGGSVCDLIDCCALDSSSPPAVKDCFSFEGDVMGECPFLPGEE